jgi:ankyrin repeat protein
LLQLYYFNNSKETIMPLPKDPVRRAPAQKAFNPAPILKERELYPEEIAKQEIRVWRDKNDVNTLHLAAGWGRGTTALALADTYPELDITDKNGRRTVHHAAMNGHTNLMETLLAGNNPASPEQRTTGHNETVLHLAVTTKKSDTVDYLLEFYPNLVLEEAADRKTPLDRAINAQDKDLVLKLVSAIPDIEQWLKENGEKAAQIYGDFDLTAQEISASHQKYQQERQTREQERETPMSILDAILPKPIQSIINQYRSNAELPYGARIKAERQQPAARVVEVG